MTGKTLLTVSDLRIWFHTRDGIIKAVDGIDFKVKRGEILAIVGESGSGKSVTCYSLLDLIPCPPGKIESGSAFFNSANGISEDLLQCSAERLRKIRGNDITVIFQDPMTSLNPYLTIGEQLIEPLLYHRNLSRKAAKKQAIALLNEVGIRQPEKRYHSFPHEFSGGMRQRVMIAMALIAEPKLLICDEPTTALDVTIQAQILKLIKKLQQNRDMGVIFITHDLAVVSDLADQVLILNEGKTEESGATETVFKQPKADYTRKLLAAIPTGHKSATKSVEQQSPQTLLEIKQLKTWFRDYSRKSVDRETPYIQAVDNVSLAIQRHEILGIVGESGCGKSTLGRSILQLVPVTAGQVIYAGQELTGLSARQLKPWRRKLQMIFQDPYASLNPRMTVFETLAEPLLYHRLATRKTVGAQVAKLMDEVGLARAYIRKYPHEFSGGQRQRIAISRAIATRPEFIVADEPVSALDVTIQAQILDLILELVERHNLTMLFISHDLSVVRYLSDRIAVMHQGKIIEEAETEHLWSQPQQEYTRMLLQAVPRF